MIVIQSDRLKAMLVDFDLVVLKEYLELAPVERLFSTLNNRWVHSQLKVLAKYDTCHTGEVVAMIEASTP